MGKESFLGDIRYEETNMLSQPPGTMTATEGGYIRKVASAQSLETVLKSDYLAVVAERDSLAEQVAELGWQPIETAPNDSTRVWVWGPWGTPVTGRLYREGWHYDWWVNTGGQVPTHWRRILLNPPEATPAQPGKEEA